MRNFGQMLRNMRVNECPSEQLSDYLIKIILMAKLKYFDIVENALSLYV